VNRRRPHNVAASVHARLRNLARERHQDFNVMLILYGLERLLARLSQSRYQDRFLLKGALLFLVWGDRNRPTRDLDLLAFAQPDVAALEAIFREVCSLPSPEPDGIVFLPESVHGAFIRKEAVYAGIRLKMNATLGTARIGIQVDVGFGDPVRPSPEEICFPTLLDHTEPRLRGYQKETVIAEKLEAMLALGMTNSRLKDYYDLWRLSQGWSFEGRQLRTSVTDTLRKRKTEAPTALPPGLTDEYAQRWGLAWRGLADRFASDDELPPLSAVLGQLRDFLLPVLQAVNHPGFDDEWLPGGPWKRRDS
jgi:predicted nucleotidyltransferase component of viral defense system